MDNLWTSPPVENRNNPFDNRDNYNPFEPRETPFEPRETPFDKFDNRDNRTSSPIENKDNKFDRDTQFDNRFDNRDNYTPFNRDIRTSPPVKDKVNLKSSPNNIALRSTTGALTTPPTGVGYGNSTVFASKISNIISSQQGDNVSVNPQAGDCLVAVAIGLKSFQPFDLLHGTTDYFGFLQDLNDFNANPTVTDSSAGAAATVTGVTISSNTFAITSVDAASGGYTVYHGSFASTNTLAGLYFTVAGFGSFVTSPPTSPLISGAVNNGTYICTANTTNTLTLANANGVAETAPATATDYVISVTNSGSNSFITGQEVILSGLAEPWLNGTVLQVAAGGWTTSRFYANYPAYNYASPPGNYVNNSEPAATAKVTGAGGNVWTPVANLNIIGSDYTPSAIVQSPPVSYPSSKWGLDGYYPSVYVWVAQNVVVTSPPTPYKINLNSVYQGGIDPPLDWASGKPIFDGGINFQVFDFAGVSAVGNFSIGLAPYSYNGKNNPATAPHLITTSGGAIISIGIMRDANAFSPGTVNVTTTSPPLVATGTAMTTISSGKLIGSETHYIVEYALVGSSPVGGYNPNFSNPQGYNMIVVSFSLNQ